MQIRGVTLVDTYAEAFPMFAARLVVTADTESWALTAARTAAGLATSVVGCGCEAGLDGMMAPEDTPDGRPGAAVLVFTVSREVMAGELLKRIGQAVLPAPTTACFNGLDVPDTIPAGGKVRYFGDGFQSSKMIGGRRYWRVPTGDGEFLVEESFGVAEGVGGGNFILSAVDRPSGLAAAEAAAAAIAAVPGAITPFPGGICRSPSKVGSRYSGLVASTNDRFCPALCGRVETALPEGARAAYEIVIDGLSQQAVAGAMRAGITAACLPGVLQITAGNYGGHLGPYHFHLHHILQEEKE